MKSKYYFSYQYIIDYGDNRFRRWTIKQDTVVWIRCFYKLYDLNIAKNLSKAVDLYLLEKYGRHSKYGWSALNEK